MKKIYSKILAVLVLCLCFLTACSPSALTNNPDKDALTTGNGGLAVIKDDYLYYVNGYEDYTNFKEVGKDNKFGSITRGGIYRTKLVDGKVVRDEDGFLTDTECVVPQCVGYSNGGFYIVGDYIYYLTPHMENARNDSGEKVLKNEWSDICRINIDGTKQKRLAYTTNNSDTIKWSVYTIEGKTYIVILDGTDLLSIDGETGKSVKMASNVASVELLQQASFVYGSSDLVDAYKYVYYTREYTEDDTENGGAGNKLCKVAINSDKEIVVACDRISNYSILGYVNGAVYYSKVKDDSNVTWVKEVYRRRVSNEVAEEKVCGNYSQFVFINNNDDASLDNGAIVVDENNYMYLVWNGSRKLLVKADKAVTLIGETGGHIYYTMGEKSSDSESKTSSDLKIYAIDYTASEPTAVEIGKSGKNYKLDNSKLIDLDGRRLFVLAEYESKDGDKNYYLNIIDGYDTETASDFVGKFADGETPAKPADPKDEETEKEQWIK